MSVKRKFDDVVETGCKKNLLTLENLPENYRYLTDNVFLCVNQFYGVSRVHIREFKTYNGVKFYPTRRGIAFYYREWKFMCDILKETKYKLDDPVWDCGLKDEDIVRSAFGITVSSSGSVPGSCALSITKGLENNSTEIILNLEQWKLLVSFHMDIKRMLIESELHLRIKNHCLPTMPLQAATTRECLSVTSAFKSILKSKLMDILSGGLSSKNPFLSAVYVTREELHDAIVSLDISEILNKTIDQVNIPQGVLPEHVNIVGLVNELEGLYVYPGDDCC